MKPIKDEREEYLKGLVKKLEWSYNHDEPVSPETFVQIEEELLDKNRFFQPAPAQGLSAFCPKCNTIVDFIEPAPVPEGDRKKLLADFEWLVGDDDFDDCDEKTRKELEGIRDKIRNLILSAPEPKGKTVTREFIDEWVAAIEPFNTKEKAMVAYRKKIITKLQELGIKVEEEEKQEPVDSIGE